MNYYVTQILEMFVKNSLIVGVLPKRLILILVRDTIVADMIQKTDRTNDYKPDNSNDITWI